MCPWLKTKKEYWYCVDYKKIFSSSLAAFELNVLYLFLLRCLNLEPWYGREIFFSITVFGSFWDLTDPVFGMIWTLSANVFVCVCSCTCAWLCIIVILIMICVAFFFLRICLFSSLVNGLRLDVTQCETNRISYVFHSAL